MAKQKLTDEDDALLSELGVDVEAKRKATRTPREERIIAGFEEIQRFVEEHGHLPSHGEDKDIFERLYAVRLDRLRELEECRTLLAPLDEGGLLDVADQPGFAEKDEEFDDDALLAELGVDAEPKGLTELRHVRSSAEIRAAEEIANREKCEDFAKFKPLFDQVQKELAIGVRTSQIIRKDAGFTKANIKQGQFFILGGQTLYVAEIGEVFRAPNGDRDARMRVIYSNGTESNLLRRSLQRALYKEEASRQISDPTAGPLFAGEAEEADLASGTVYVLRSKSQDPFVSEHRQLIHKIGVTGGSVEKRIANAAKDPTFLMADVEIVATYTLYNINRTKLENLIHRFFDAARLDVTIKDRFGQPIVPREWFLVPLKIIDEAIEHIRTGTVADFVFDVKLASLLKRDQK